MVIVGEVVHRANHVAPAGAIVFQTAVATAGLVQRGMIVFFAGAYVLKTVVMILIAVLVKSV